MALKILIADDSMIAQNMGKKILSDAGYEVLAVSNGAAAVKKLAEAHPDIILLDVYMPGYSGLEVCERVKSSPETARIPVLLTVGKLEPFRPEDGMKAKADGLIIKPFEATDLLTVVGKLAERVQAAPAAPRKPAAAIAEPEPQTAEPESRQMHMPSELAAAPAMMEEFVVEPTPASAPMDVPPAPAFTVEHEPVAQPEPAPATAAEAINLQPFMPEPEDAAEAAEVMQAQPLEATPAQPAGLPSLEIRFEVAPAPDLEFASAPKETPEYIPPDEKLVTDRTEIITPTIPLPVDDSFVVVEEPPELAVFDGHQPEQADHHSEARVADALEAFEKAAAIPEERPKVVPDVVLEPVVMEPEAAETEQPVSFLDAALRDETPQARAAAASVVPSKPPTCYRAPLGKTSFDDNLGRALESMLADAVTAQNQKPPAEVPRSLDDIDEALGLLPGPPLEEAEEAEAEQEIVIPPKEERVNVSFGPDVGDAKEIVGPPQPVKPEPVAQVTPVKATPLSVPPVQPVEIHPVAAVPAPGPGEAKPSVSREQAIASVDKALDTVNRAIAKQIVDRVLERVRPELVEEVVRLLKQG
ncbi:MAG: response regulator [Terriglobales bacterium]